MAESLEFIKDRAAKTISAAKKVAVKWTWQEQTIEELQASLTAITGNSSATPPIVGQEEVTSQTGQAMLASRGAWDEQLDTLHALTVQGVTMARTRNRNHPANLAVLNALSARGTSRAEILSEALAWESAWTKVDAAWVPVPMNTLTAFKVLRKQCAENLQQAYTDAQTDYRSAAEKLNGMTAGLEKTIQAWYADATAVFRDGSADGNMIRSTVPTIYNPPAEKESTMTLSLPSSVSNRAAA